MDIIDSLGATGSKWEKYQELYPQILDLENSLAEEWFSPELMAQLRYENIRWILSKERLFVVNQIQAQIIGYLKNGSFKSRNLADIVNFIRQRESLFEEWHGSEVAKLFAPPVFHNRKKSAGYFF